MHCVTPFEPTPGLQAETWRCCLETDDIDAHAAAQPEWVLRYEQLSRGAFRGSVRHVQLPGLRLAQESSSQAVHQQGELGPDCYGFAMALSLPGPAYFDGQPLDDGAIMVGRADHLDLCSPARFSMIGAVISTELFDGFWQRIRDTPLPAWLERQSVLRLPPGCLQALRALHLDALQTLDHPRLDDVVLRQVRDEILLEWIEALPGEIDMAGLRSAAARKRVVDRACAVMRAHAGQPLSILELCSRIGASRRKLNYCFQDALGITPIKYLRAIRLNGARRELKTVRDLGTGVQDVAARWGFWHLGQFSLDYKLQFGELPSATLRAARMA